VVEVWRYLKVREVRRFGGLTTEAQRTQRLTEGRVGKQATAARLATPARFATPFPIPPLCESLCPLCLCG